MSSVPAPASGPVNCLQCPVRTTAVFCNLSATALEYLQKVRIPSHVPKGTTICFQGQPARGVYIMCSGRAKLSANSSTGRSLIVRVARPGELIGITSQLLGDACEVTAETMEGSVTSFVTRTDFAALVRKFPEVEGRVVAQLTNNYRNIFHELRSFGLAHGVAGKLAALLLDEVARQATPNQAAKNQRIKLRMTQEEIAEMIGSTRETVSRQLAEFKRKGLIKLNGTTLTVVNRAALEVIAG